MSRIRRVVLDTSTLVNAALREGSIPHQDLLKAFSFCDLCATSETMAELESVLDRSKFDRYMDRDLRREFVAMIRRRVQLFAVGEAESSAVQPRCGDPKDDPFLVLALAAEADVIVSSDEDLLVLHPWCGIPILTPAAFLSVSPMDQLDQA